MYEALACCGLVTEKLAEAEAATVAAAFAGGGDFAVAAFAGAALAALATTAAPGSSLASAILPRGFPGPDEALDFELPCSLGAGLLDAEREDESLMRERDAEGEREGDRLLSLEML